MKGSSLTFTFLSTLSALVDARSVHIDVSEHDGIAVDINLDTPRDLPPVQNESPRKERHRFLPKTEDLKEYQVDLYYGIYEGTLSEDSKYVSFSNIPYAEPPVGEFRWVPPVPIYDRREGINNGSKKSICPQYQVGWVPAAIEFINDTLQKPVLPEKWTKPIGKDDYESFKPKPELDPRSDEDCLFLDVKIPKKIWDERNKPAVFKPAVIVWIHGGGYVFGWKDQFGSADGLFEAAEGEDEQNVIHVSMNYRLGAFGWLGGEKLWDEGGVANAGLWDQKAALEWVRDNIHSFGGDSRRITAVGQSAGASSILHHITARSGRYDRPAFKSAIIQSPGFFPQPNSTKDDETYDKFLKASNAKDFEELQKKDTKTLMQANADITYESSYGLFNFGPTVDYDFVRDLPSKLLQSGDFHEGIPILVGHTKFDGLLFTPPWIRTNEQLRQHVRTLYPGVSDAVLDEVEKRYPIKDLAFAKEKILKVADFLDDVAIQCNSHYLTQATLKSTSRTYHPVYRYVFNIFPAIHGADVPYTYYPSIETKPPVDEKVAKFLQKAIVDFTRYVDPNPENSEFWKPYTTENKKVLNFGSPGLIPTHAITYDDDKLDEEKCNYWQPAPYFVPRRGKGLGHASFKDQTRPERFDL